MTQTYYLPRAPQGLKLDICGRFYFLFFCKIKYLNLLVKFSCFCNVLEIWKYLTKHKYMIFCSTKKDNFNFLSKIWAYSELPLLLSVVLKATRGNLFQIVFIIFHPNQKQNTEKLILSFFSGQVMQTVLCLKFWKSLPISRKALHQSYREKL